MGGSSCGKSGGVACSCHRVWDGKHITGPGEPDWRGPIIVARDEIVSQVPVS